MDDDTGVEPVVDFDVELHFEAAVVSGGAEEGIRAAFGGLADDLAVDGAAGGSAIVLSPALESLAIEKINPIVRERGRRDQSGEKDESSHRGLPGGGFGPTPKGRS